MYSINYLSIIDLLVTDECPLCKRYYATAL